MNRMTYREELILTLISIAFGVASVLGIIFFSPHTSCN